MQSSCIGLKNLDFLSGLQGNELPCPAAAKAAAVLNVPELW